MRYLGQLLVFLLIASPGVAQNVPPTTERALDGSTIVFPRPESQRPLLLIVGFSRSSASDFDKWNKRILSSYISDPYIEYYELPDLQDVPSMVRAMILHGMRRSVHGAEQAHFVPLTAKESEWKSAVGYAEPVNTYVLLANPAGHVVWQARGVPDDEKVSALKQALEKLAPSQH